MIRNRLVLVLLIPVLLTGCWDSRPVDELDIITNITIDHAPTEGNIRLNLISPNFEEDRDELTHKSTVEGTSIMAALSELQKRSSKVYVLGSVNNVLIGKSLSESGIKEILLELDHISEFEAQAVLAILDGTIEELESFKTPQQQRTGTLILSTIESSVKKQMIPESMLYQTMILYSLKGREMVFPLIRVGDQNDAVIDGLAIFKEDKMVGKLNLSEGTPYLIFTLPSIDELIIHIPFEETEPYGVDKLSVVIRKKEVHIQTEVKGNVPIVNTEISLTVDEVDFIPVNGKDASGKSAIIDKKSVRKGIESAISNYLKKQTKALFFKTQQKFESDIFGFGEKVRVQNNAYFKSVNWGDVYPKAKITCEYRVDLRRFGAIK